MTTLSVTFHHLSVMQVSDDVRERGLLYSDSAACVGVAVRAADGDGIRSVDKANARVLEQEAVREKTRLKPHSSCRRDLR